MEAMNQMSQGIDKLIQSLAVFQAEVEQPKLNKENPYFKSRYVDLSGVLQAVTPALKKAGLSYTQLVNGDELDTYLFHNESGQWIKSTYPLGILKTSQDRGSAITYGRRYALCAMLGIVADVDDDGNAATDSQKKNKGIANGYDSTTEQALADVAAITTEAELQGVWKKWNGLAKSICIPGTAFHKALSEKKRQLQSKAV